MLFLYLDPRIKPLQSPPRSALTSIPPCHPHSFVSPPLQSAHVCVSPLQHGPRPTKHRTKDAWTVIYCVGVAIYCVGVASMRTASLVLCRGCAVAVPWLCRGCAVSVQCLCRGYTSLVRYSYSAYVMKGEEIRAIKNSVVYTSGMAIPFVLSDRN
jgi:hypothetical protein